MNALALEQLLLLFPEIETYVSGRKIKLVRHAVSAPAWQDFNKKLRFNKKLLAVFTGEQGKDIFQEQSIVLTFTPHGGGQSSLFRGAFKCEGRIDQKRFANINDSYLEYETLLREINPERDPTGHIFYNLIPFEPMDVLNDRLVIDWGGSTISWHQTKLDKKILQILPEGFVTKFPGWDKVFISHQELQAITAHKDGNQDWYEFLSKNDGVYLITDKPSGKHYVGSATGGTGIWARWAGYAQTGHNDNKLLKESHVNPELFCYSLHHVFPKGSKTVAEVLAYESLLKQKLGSRALGLNAN